MSDDDDRDDEGSSEEEEDGALPSVLKPFMQGSEEPLLTAKRVANYTEGEACYGIVVGQKVRPKWTITLRMYYVLTQAAQICTRLLLRLTLLYRGT